MSECPICWSRYIINYNFDENTRHPVTLNPCGHTFCNGCIQRMLDIANSPINNDLEVNLDEERERRFKCPECRDNWRVLADLRIDMLRLPRNYEFERVTGMLNQGI